jgi:GTP-binding protein Era
MQMIFLDTPGWLKPTDAFQSSMKRAILRSLFDDADAILWLIEPRPLFDDDKAFAEQLAKSGKPVFVGINKMDTISGKEAIKQTLDSIKGDLPPSFTAFGISAKGKQGLDPLKVALKDKLPESPAYFPTDQVTDRWERFYVTELIREQIFSMYEQEIPHAAAVVIEEFKEQEGRKDLIRATIYVETEGQKQIVVGKKGAGILKLGKQAREEIEGKLGRPVYLELFVKIKKKWRQDEGFLRQIHEANYS